MLNSDMVGKWGPPILALCLISLISSVACQDGYGAETDALNNDDALELTAEEKRGGFKAVPFHCNGYDNVPRCQHGGKGPRKTQTRSGNFCVCLCPKDWIGPECGVRSDASGIAGKRDDEGEEDKRAWGSLNSLQLGKRLTLPWGLKQVKRNLPWALKSFPVKKDGTAEMMPDEEEEEEEEKRALPWALKAYPGKKSFPWALKAMPGKKNFPWALKTMDGKGKRASWSFSSVPLGKRSTVDSDSN